MNDQNRIHAIDPAEEVEPHGLKEVVSVGVAVAALAGSAAGTAAAAGAAPGADGPDTVLVSRDAAAPNVQVAQQYFEQVWSGDFAGGEKLTADGYGIFGPQAEATDQSGCQKRIATIVGEYREGFPDIHFDVQSVSADADTVVIDWIATGTHGGSFWGLEPTGLPVKVPGSTTYTVRDGQITQEVYGFDVRDVFEQLGAKR